MVKYKVVITGTNRKVAEDFFVNVDEFEAVMSSVYPQDISRHIKFFEPQVFMVCLSDDARTVAHSISQIDKELMDAGCVFVLVGSEEDINKYNEMSNHMPDITCIRPLTNQKIVSQIKEYLVKKETEAEALRIKKEEQEAKLKRPHILIVDDDPNVLNMLTKQLSNDYRVATASNGGLALRYLSKKTTDLILLDYEMPVQNGPQMLTILRGSESTKDIPVIFLTGVSDQEKIAKVLSYGPKGYLLKPVNYVKLMKTIKDVLGE